MSLIFEQDRNNSDWHAPGPAIALLPAGGALWEDFLDTIGMPLEKFCREGPGGWLLGYIDAFTFCGLRTVLIFFSARISAPLRYRHTASGTTIVGLPAPTGYRALRGTLESMSKYAPERHGFVRRNVLRTLEHVIPHLSTPLYSLSRELRREQCRAILCQEYEDFRFDTCILLGGILRLPVFATFQGGTFEPNLISRALRPLTIRSSAGLFIAPEAEIERVRTKYNVPAARVLRIFNPIDSQMWSPIARGEARAAFDLPPGARVAVWHGRVAMEPKGLDVLLDAWRQVSHQRPGRDLRLLLMGTGENAGLMQQRLDALCMPNVQWINEYVRDHRTIRRFLSAGDVYAFPSRREGFAVAPIEAMACGLPVVAADASGVPDLFSTSEGTSEAAGGIVVPRGDAAAFADALGRILDNEPLGRDLGQRARRRVDQVLSLGAVGRQLRTFLQQLGMPVAERAYHDFLCRIAAQEADR